MNNRMDHERITKMREKLVLKEADQVIDHLAMAVTEAVAVRRRLVRVARLAVEQYRRFWKRRGGRP